MKKLFVFTYLTISSISLLSCAQTQAKKSTPLKNVKSMTVKVEHDAVSTISSKHSPVEDYTHELAEADAADGEIKSEVGVADIDDEISEAEPAGQGPIPFLKNKQTNRMQFWVDYFTKKQRERFQRFIDNGEEYRHHIEAVLEEHGLPKELYFVGLIESGYYLGARSHAGAQGPWQFIKGTGQRYGLKITPELDERQDLFKATKAAAMYFKDLHNVFSSWELALSAYNAGEYGIIRRIMKHGTRDFYELSRNKQLPSETINYVPKVLAAMHVINNAKKYGFDIPQKKHRLFDLTELRSVQKNMPLSGIARTLQIDVEILRKLNPELKQSATPKKFIGNYFIRVPKSKYAYRLGDLERSTLVTSTAPEKAPALIPEPAKTIQTTKPAALENKNPTQHRVKNGETLLSIARKYDITPGQLARANNFTNWRTRVRKGQTLTLVRTQTRPRFNVVKKPITYQVRPGDNLTIIAQLFNSDLATIKSVNKLKRGKIMVGQKLILPNTQKGIYTVRPGDHLTKVAKDFNQPIEALIKLNQLKRKTIYPGQKLIVNMD